MAEHAPSGDKLGQMANQIAAFYHAYPETEARAGIAQHIADFWTPGMRRALRALAAQGRCDLDPLVLRALAGNSSTREET